MNRVSMEKNLDALLTVQYVQDPDQTAPPAIPPAPPSQSFLESERIHICIQSRQTMKQPFTPKK